MDAPPTLTPEHSGSTPEPEYLQTGKSISPVAQGLNDYHFPDEKIKAVMDDSSKIPLLLVACGSFNPITFLHLRLFEMAADHVKRHTNYEVIGGILSPVSDFYKKVGLASVEHRLRMTELAIQTSSWLSVDNFEATRKEYTRTAVVLEHVDHEMRSRQGVRTSTGERKAVKVALLAGADLLLTMSSPGVWSAQDLEIILGRFGAFIVERSGTDIDAALSHLQPWKQNIHVVPQLIQNDVSSTLIRLFLRKEMSVRYLIPAPVIQYIEEHGLYEDDGVESSTRERQQEGKGKLPVSPPDSEGSQT